MTKISSSSEFSSLRQEISNKKFGSVTVIEKLKEELSSILSAKKIKAKETIARLDAFECDVIRPYMDTYLQEHDILESSKQIKKLQSIKEKVMDQKYFLKNYLFNKKIDAIVRSKSVSRIESTLRHLEELFWKNDSLGSRDLITKQAEKCIDTLPLVSQQNDRKRKFDMITPQL